VYFTLTDLVTDITQNACESGAKTVWLEVEQGDGEFLFAVRDDGVGMNSAELLRALDPFVSDGKKHPQRKVGLGLPLFIQTVEQSGGRWDIQSEKEKGTSTRAWFDTTHLDTPPVGDVPQMFMAILMFEGPQMLIRRSWRQEGNGVLDYELCKTELVAALGDFEDVSSLVLLNKYLRSLENECV